MSLLPLLKRKKGPRRLPDGAASGTDQGGGCAGIDEEEWNPDTDRHIVQKYSASNFEQGKAANKAALQKELGLPEQPDVPLVGFIGRLDFQKGADLVLAAAPW